VVVLPLLVAFPVGGTAAAPPPPGAQSGAVSHVALILGGCCASRVAWSPDGTTLAAGGTGALHLLHSDGQAVATVVGLPSPILGLAWSPDGTLLATGSADGLVRTYTASGQQAGVFGGRGGAVNAVGWSPDGRLLATASADGGMRVYQSNHELLTTLFAGYHQTAFALSWSSMHTKHGTVLAYATNDGVQIQTVGGERVIATVDRGLGVRSLSWSPDGQRLVTGLADGTLHLWSARGTALSAIRGLGAPVSWVAWSPDGTRIAAAAGSDVQVWDAAGQPLASLTGPGATVQSLSWSADSQSLAAVSGDDRVHIWHLPS
jgi:WD40 repeat protein